MLLNYLFIILDAYLSLQLPLQGTHLHSYTPPQHGVSLQVLLQVVWSFKMDFLSLILWVQEGRKESIAEQSPRGRICSSL